MSELTLLLLRMGFLILLWLFIFGIVYALRSDLFGAPARRLRNRNEQLQPAAQASALASQNMSTDWQQHNNGNDYAAANDLPSAGSATPARTLIITSGVANGTEISLDEEFVTIGRSPDSTLVIVDEYTSTHHARLQRTTTGWQLTDLDSTNGTKVNNSRISGTVDLAVFEPVTIGTTTFELRP